MFLSQSFNIPYSHSLWEILKDGYLFDIGPFCVIGYKFIVACMTSSLNMILKSCDEC